MINLTIKISMEDIKLLNLKLKNNLIFKLSGIVIFILLLMVVILMNGEIFSKIPQVDGKAYLVYKRNSDYQIIVGKDATKAELTAASELQRYLKNMTNCKLSIYKDDEKEEQPLEILIGKTNREDSKAYTIDRDSLGKEGFLITWSDKKLIIAGGSERGTLYAIYDLLENLGCRFFTTDTEIVPKVKTIEMDLSTIITEKPAFEYRDLFWYNTFDENLSVKLRLNGCLLSDNVGCKISDTYGGGIQYAGPKFVHTFSNLVPADKYFKEHPEYFSEIKGVRTAKHLYSQLCMTNSDVLNIVIAKTKEWLDANPDAKIVSISQDDSFVIDSYCTCAACKAIIKEEGSEAGPLLRFVNSVADAIKDEYPDVAVDTLAYQYSIKPPKKTVPRDNVIIRYCTGGCSAHSIADCKNNSGVVANIKQWSKFSDRIYIWDYTTNFAQYLCPYPNLNTLQANVQFFAANNVKGVFEQGNYQNGLNGEFGELRSYILAKLLWDPNTDVQVHIKEFMDAYYGQASNSVQKYIDFIHKIVADDGRHFNLVISAADLFKDLISDEDIAAYDALWDEAKKEAGSDEIILSHVKRSELQWRYYKMLTKRGEFSNSSEYDKLEKQFNKDCTDLGVLRLSEGAEVPWVNPKK